MKIMKDAQDYVEKKKNPETEANIRRYKEERPEN